MNYEKRDLRQIKFGYILFIFFTKQEFSTKIDFYLYGTFSILDIFTF